MNEQLRIQERLKEIATELSALADAENPTEDQDNLFESLSKEADQLTIQLNDMRAASERDERRQRANEIRSFATSGTRLTQPNRTGHVIGRQRLAVEDDPNRGFKSLAHFATRVAECHANPRGDEMLMQVAAGTGMTQSVSSEGGVLVPPAFSRSIWDRAMEQSESLLSYCDRYPVDAGNESVTFPAVNQTSRVNGSRWGGVQGYWKGELTQMNSSQIKMREVKLSPHELYVFCFISDKLLRNAPGTASALLERSAADEMSFKIGDAIINGDGNGKPLGVIGHAGTVSVAKETGQAAATLVTENIRKMWSRCHGRFRANAAWFVNQEVETQLDGLKFEVGTGGVPVMLPPGGLSGAPYRTLYGRPVIPIEYCAALGTEGDIILANLQSYAVGLKGMMDTAYSMHLKFDYAQTAYRIIFEIDGQPWLNSVITPFKGASTLSPIVTLATRG